jgi:hypothetical protein
MQSRASLPKARRRYVRYRVATLSLLLGPLIITISNPCPYRSISGRSRNCRGVNIGRPLLLCLIVIIGVIDDDYLAVTKWPEDVTVEVTKKLSGEFLIARGVNNKRRTCSLGSPLRHCLARTLMSNGGAMRHLMGTPVEVEIRMAPVGEFLHCQAEDFPL